MTAGYRRAAIHAGDDLPEVAPDPNDDVIAWYKIATDAGGRRGLYLWNDVSAKWVRQGNQRSVTVAGDETTIILTNQPSAEQFLLNTARYMKKLDLSAFEEVRLVVYKDATSGAASAKLQVKYSASFSTTVGSFSDIGTSPVEVAINTTNTMLDSGWIPLAAGALDDVYVVVTQSGGDGILDPAFGTIEMQFR